MRPLVSICAIRFLPFSSNKKYERCEICDLSADSPESEEEESEPSLESQDEDSDDSDSEPSFVFVKITLINLFYVGAAMSSCISKSSKKKDARCDYKNPFLL